MITLPFLSSGVFIDASCVNPNSSQEKVASGSLLDIRSSLLPATGWCLDSEPEMPMAGTSTYHPRRSPVHTTWTMRRWYRCHPVSGSPFLSTDLKPGFHSQNPATECMPMVFSVRPPTVPRDIMHLAFSGNLSQVAGATPAQIWVAGAK